MYYIVRNSDNRGFVDGLFEPSDFAWMKPKHSTMYKTFEEAEKRMQSNPFSATTTKNYSIKTRESKMR